MPLATIRLVASGLAVALLLAAGPLACDRAIEPYVPGEQAEAPDLSRIFPEGAEVSSAREAQSTAPGQAPAEVRGPPPPPSPQTASAEAIRGVVTLAPELEGRVPAGAILFLIARRGEGGPPLAVQRIVEPQLPLEFAIGPEDRMIDQVPFEGPLVLSARLDSDGNAMTRLPGDLQGAAPGAYQPGDSGVVLLIDEAL